MTVSFNQIMSQYITIHEKSLSRSFISYHDLNKCNKKFIIFFFYICGIEGNLF